ncbi:MAG: DUF1572 family protein [Flavobacteriales bacterium]|nr:DUF1572 family protein [Flavobacteriales bacterium]
MSVESNYIQNSRTLCHYYKDLGEKAMVQVEEKRLFWAFNNDSNSIALIVQHVGGNMLSRFTNFYDEDGEKSWRNRDGEFELRISTSEELMKYWENAWKVLFDILDNLKDEDLSRIVYIRNEGHTVLEALNRQLAHYSYHIGQIVFLSKMVAADGWKSLSIPKNGSEAFNHEKFQQEKGRRNFIK